MKVIHIEPRRWPSDPPAGHCHDCHNTARWLLTFGAKRPDLRLCERCAKYLGGTLLDRIAERQVREPLKEGGE